MAPLLAWSALDPVQQTSAGLLPSCNTQRRHQVLKEYTPLGALIFESSRNQFVSE
jgi:hypothetical protein